jgi:predicted Zn-dependent protease
MTARSPFTGAAAIVLAICAGCVTTRQPVPVIAPAAANTQPSMGPAREPVLSVAQSPRPAAAWIGDVADVAARHGLVRAPALESYLASLLRRIAAAAGRNDAPALILSAAPGLDAYATANGSIVVSLAWIVSVESEDEMVALLSHEYAHMALAHHGSDRVGQAARWANVLFQATGSARTGTSAGWGDLSVLGITRIGLPGWQRGQEQEADAFALEVGTKLGYSPAAGTKAFLERIGEWEAGFAKPATSGSTSVQRSKRFSESLREAADSPLGTTHDGARERLAALEARFDAASRGPRAAPRRVLWLEVLAVTETARILDAYMQVGMARRHLASNRMPAALDALKAARSRGIGAPWIAEVESQAYDQQFKWRESDEALAGEIGGPLMWASVQRLVEHDIGNSRHQRAIEQLDGWIGTQGPPPSLYPEAMMLYRRIQEQLPSDSPATRRIESRIADLSASCLVRTSLGPVCTFASMTRSQQARQTFLEQGRVNQVDNRIDQGQNRFNSRIEQQINQTVDRLFRRLPR